MSRTTIHHLPAEMLCAVFGHLSLSDRLEKKSVCKLWNELISTLKIERLSVDADLLLKDRWYHSNRPCSESELCHPDLFVVQHQRSALPNLKYLRFCSRLWNKKLKDFDLNQLNTFSQLVHLELHYYKDDQLCLKLPNLQLLMLAWPSSYCGVELDCPKLRIFINREHAESNSLRIHHPASIRFLETGTFGRKLALFENLEYLRYRYCDVKLIDLPALLKLKKLKEVHYDFDLESINDFMNLMDGRDDTEETIEALKEFMKQKNAFRPNLQVYFSGLRLIAEDLSDIDSMQKKDYWRYFLSNEEVYMRNYGRLQDNMDFVLDVNYSVLLASAPVLPGDYFSRFCNLCRVTATCPLDEQRFLTFLRKLYRLESLKIYDSNLSQNFFDLLAEFRLLARLGLLKSSRENAEDNEIHLDFSFIGHFEELSFVEIDQNLSLASLPTFIASFRNLRRVFSNEWPFKFEGKMFKVKRNGKCYDEEKLAQSYNLMIVDGQRTLLENVDLDEVIRYVSNGFQA